MQPHDRVNFNCWSLFREQPVLVPCEQGLLSQLCCSLHSSQRKASVHPFARLLFRFMLQRTRHINVDLLVSLRFVSFPGLKNEAYTCVLSLFRRAFAPLHSFTMLVSTRSEKQRTVNSLAGLLSASTLHPHPQPQPESGSMIRPENRYSSV